MKSRLLLISLFALGAISAASAQVFGDGGHFEVKVKYEEGFELEVENHDTEEEFEVSNVLFFAGANTRTTIPGGSQWGFLGGNAGDPIWVLPQDQIADQLYLGLATEGLPDIFATDITFELARFSGPGQFAFWQTDSFGDPIELFSTANGLGDSFTLPIDSEFHANWGFTQTGIYSVGLRVSATLLDGTVVSSDVTDVTFGVEAVPEPATLAAMGLGLAALARRRRRGQK